MRREVSKNVIEKGHIEEAWCCRFCVNCDKTTFHCMYWDTPIEPTDRCQKYTIFIGGKEDGLHK